MTAQRLFHPLRPLATALPALRAAALVAATPFAAAATPAGEDPPGLARFPEAEIVKSEHAQMRGYEFVTGRVERSRRERRVESSVRVPAQVLRVTYQTPVGTRLDDVLAHYRRETAGLTEVFACRGRDCGRSTVWANDIFRVKELVAPDPAQFYLAAAGGDVLVAVYVVQRGNRRVFAHVDFARGDGLGDLVRPGQASAPDRADTDGLAKILRLRGYAVVPEVAPDATGALGDAALATLDAVAATLGGLDGDIHVVCHLDGDAQIADAIAHSKTCAEQAAARLRAAGVQATPFGAGPLLPRPDAPRRRVELVVP